MPAIARPLIAITTVLALTACAAATVASSGVHRTGRDTYAVYSSMQGHVSDSQDHTPETHARALADANAYCTQQGMGLAAVIKEQQLKDSHSGVVIDFSCGG